MANLKHESVHKPGSVIHLFTHMCSESSVYGRTKTFSLGIKVKSMGLSYSVAGKKPEGMSKDIYYLNIRKHEMATMSECVVSKKQWEHLW